MILYESSVGVGWDDQVVCVVCYLQHVFSKQKGYLDEELDYRKQSMAQAHKVRHFKWTQMFQGKKNLPL